MPSINKQRTLLRLKDVLALYPISRTSWYDGVKLGMYPQPLRLGKKTVAWSAQDIETAINLLNKKKTPVVGADESVHRQ